MISVQSANVVCKCCQSLQTTVLHPETASGTIYRCASCGFCFVEPTPNPEYFQRLYSGSKGSPTYRLRRKRIFVGYLREVQRVYGGDNVKATPLLDVGSGDSYFVELARDAGFHAFGVDLAAHWGSPGEVKCCRCDVGSLCFTNNVFSILTIWSSLEHFPQPSKVIAECSRVARRGGALFVTVPCADAMLHKLCGATWSQYIPGHLGFYTVKSLTLLLALHGFEAVRFWRPSSTTSIASILMSRGRNVDRFLGNPMMPLLLHPISNPLTSMIGVVATKCDLDSGAMW